jgi:hypothetical protein
MIKCKFLNAYAKVFFLLWKSCYYGLTILRIWERKRKYWIQVDSLSTKGWHFISTEVDILSAQGWHFYQQRADILLVPRLTFCQNWADYFLSARGWHFVSTDLTYVSARLIFVSTELIFVRPGSDHLSDKKICPVPTFLSSPACHSIQNTVYRI